MTVRTAVVIGGGIVGLTAAYALTLEGIAVTVVDPDEPHSRASTSTAGIIGGSSVIPWASTKLWARVPRHALRPNGPLKFGFPPPKNLLPYFNQSFHAGRCGAFRTSARGLAELGLRGWGAWEMLLAKLPEAKALFHKDGCLLLYPEQSDRDADEANNALRRELGMQLAEVDADTVRDLLPSLGRPTTGAVKVVAAGHVADPLGLQLALRNALCNRDVVFVTARATGFRRSRDRIDAVLTEAGEIAGDGVVLAAGSGSARLAAKLGCRIPMIPAHGASLTFEGSDVDLALPALVLKDGIAFTPSTAGLRVSGLLQVGGASKTRSSRLERILFRLAKHYFGAFHFDRTSGTSGPRPLTPDSLPVIGAVPGFSNAWFDFGHGHWGLTQAAVSAQIIADQVQHRPSEPNLAFYRPDRF